MRRLTTVLLLFIAVTINAQDTFKDFYKNHKIICSFWASRTLTMEEGGVRVLNN